MGNDHESSALPVGITLVEATEGSRQQLLTVARRRLAEVIDGNVPVHALARLLGELDRLDHEIRRLEAVVDAEVHIPDDEPFDPSTI